MSSPTRRQFLKLGAFGAAFTLADQLRAAALRPPRARSAIMIVLPGGPPHLDTWDPKPDAPAEIRGEFGSISTRVPGVRISEHFPFQAKLFDKLAVIRSITGMSEEHADVQIQTGYSSTDAKAGGRPSFGAVVSKQRGWTGGMPPFVSLRGMTSGAEPGSLGFAHRAFAPGDEAEGCLRLSADLSPSRLAGRRSLLAGLGVPGRDDASEAMDGYQQQALEMIMSGKVCEALSLKGEDEATLERYSGVEALLKARRLAEAGVGCVTVSLGSWDTHANNFERLRDQLPLADQGISALVSDLHERGLADEMVVLAWGEFGRTPRVNAAGGRDHWTPVMSAVLAGGGLRTGQVIGATGRHGERPTRRPCTMQQVLATIYRSVGIDPSMTIRDAGGRSVFLVEDRDTIPELL